MHTKPLPLFVSSLLMLIFLSAPSLASADEKTTQKKQKEGPRPNAILLEGFGPGLWYSFNYERRIPEDIGLRLGFGAIPLRATVTTRKGTELFAVPLFTFPLGISYLGLRRGNHTLELGGGVTVSYSSRSTTTNSSDYNTSGFGMYTDVLAGYRWQPAQNPGFQLRLGAMALIGKALNVFGVVQREFNVAPFGYLSLGYAF